MTRVPDREPFVKLTRPVMLRAAGVVALVLFVIVGGAVLNRMQSDKDRKAATMTLHVASGSGRAHIRVTTGGGSSEGDIPTPQALSGYHGYFYVQVSNVAGESGAVSCEIVRGDGVVLANNAATGAYGIASCSP